MRRLWRSGDLVAHEPVRDVDERDGWLARLVDRVLDLVTLGGYALQVVGRLEEPVDRELEELRGGGDLLEELARVPTEEEWRDMRDEEDDLPRRAGSIEPPYDWARDRRRWPAAARAILVPIDGLTFGGRGRMVEL